MKKFILLCSFIYISTFSFSQKISTDTLLVKSYEKPVTSDLIYSDSLVSSFVLSIKDEVKTHKHVHHTEQVFVLSGIAMMTLSGRTFEVKEGDMIIIPKGEIHSVKVITSPLRVISVQAPNFDGKDRIFVE
jgi:mannose-6-phosphate isomerase-like protein (cupin superfamily)